MEVGAVKQAFNNELILLKKKLDQAKLLTIHKLTRKAKTLVEKKAPDKLKEKLKRKAEHAVKEVLIIKKIKARDIGKFIVTHKGQLQDYLNKPVVDHDKGCARLLLHKALQDKYKFIRNRFADVPIKDLFMSREERRKIKKEAREKQKEKRNKKENNNKNKAVNAEGDWDVEDIEMDGNKDHIDDKDDSSVANEFSDEEEKVSNADDDLEENNGASDSESENVENSNGGSNDENSNGGSNDENSIGGSNDGENEDVIDEETTDVGIFVKPSPDKKDTKLTTQSKKETVVKNYENNSRTIDGNKKKPGKNQKDIIRNKNFNEKILLRKFKKESDDSRIAETKVVDPFFITSTGENYMSVAEPRQPDEVKEVHKQGNRKLRRAVMFGHVPKIKPRQDYKKFDRQNGFEKKYDSGPDKTNQFHKDNQKFNRRFDDSDNKRPNFKDRNVPSRKFDEVESKPEKLHPSWEAKKRQSGILPFQGKKIVFDES